MASSPRPKGQIRRVPVPSRHLAPTPAPAHISPTIISPSAITQTSSSSLPLLQTDFLIRGQCLPRAPIPLVETNSWQPLPTYSSYGGEHDHYAQTRHLDASHLIRMDPGPQNQHFTLPPQLEEDIKAAVRASMPSRNQPIPIKKRKTVIHRKIIRWISLSLCIILIIGEIPVSVIFNLDIAALFAFILVST
jgi:hypothetical protein